MTDISQLAPEGAATGPELIPALLPNGSGGYTPVSLTAAQIAALAGGGGLTKQAIDATGGPHTITAGEAAHAVLDISIASNVTVTCPASGAWLVNAISTTGPILGSDTLNPSDMAATLALSGGNLTVTNSGTASSAWATVRAANPIMPGEVVKIEFTPGTISGNGFVVGAMPAATTLADYPGQSGSNGFGIVQGAPVAFLNNGTVTNVGTLSLSAATTYAIIIDDVHHKAWGQTAAGYFGPSGVDTVGTAENPNTNTGGFTIPAIGSLGILPAVSLYYAGEAATLNFGAGSFSLATPTTITTGGSPYTLTFSNGSGSVAIAGNTSEWVEASGTLGVSTTVVGSGGGAGTVTLTGDITGSGTASIATTLAASGVTAGTYSKITVDAKGRATNGSAIGGSDVTAALGFTPYNNTNPSGFISGNQTITLGGDLSGSGATSISGTVGSIGGKAVSLGGSVTFSGAFATTITVTGATTVTLPTSGTLATTANINSAVPSATSSQIYVGTGSAGAAAAASAIPNGITATTQAAGSNDTKVATDAYVYTATSAITSVVTTGGTTTLSAAQYGQPIINITGTLASNAIITAPTQGEWTVLNNTSGAFTVTVNSGAGTSVAVTQGKSALVTANGTNVVQSITDISPVIDLLGNAQGDLLYRNASGWVVLAPGTSGQLLQTNGAAANPGWASVPNGFLGSGVDGAISLSSPVTQTRDYQATNLTLNSGGTLYTAGYAVYCTGTLDLSSAQAGAITFSAGTAAGNGTASAGGTAGVCATVYGRYMSGRTGGVGGTPSTTTGGAGTSPGAATGSYTFNAAPAAPSGGAGTSAAGAGGGSLAVGYSTNLSSGWPAPDSPDVVGLSGSALGYFGGGTYGSGGGAGGGDSTNKGGGGGGGGYGGGKCRMRAYALNRGASTAAGAINFAGSKGGNGFTPTVGNCGGGGGGNGGGGGYFDLAVFALLGSAVTNLIDVSGGAGGTAGSGIGTGVAGTGGTGGPSGYAAVIQMGVTGWTAGTQFVAANTAGSVGSGTSGGAGATAKLTV
jgi:hypothetical protein